MGTLYDINKELLALVNSYENNVENATDEPVEFNNDIFDQLSLQFNDKIKNIAMVMREKEGETTIIDNEIKRLLALKTNKLNTVEKLKNYISRALQSQQIEKLDLDIFKFSFRESQSLEIVDEAIVLDQFKEKVVTETIKIDKNKIKAFMKTMESPNTLPGIRLVVKQNLQIK